MKNRIATTVKVDPELYNKFKTLGVSHKMTLQKLFEKTIFKYVNEEAFRSELNWFILPIINETSGSLL